MNSEQLKRGIELEKLIKTTGEGIVNIELFIEENIKRNSDYNLCIAKHRDGSGNKVELSRYEGNSEVLDGILQILGKQLLNFKSEFDKL